MDYYCRIWYFNTYVCVYHKDTSYSCQGMETQSSMYTLYCEHSLLTKIKDLTDIIYTDVNKVTSGQAIG